MDNKRKARRAWLFLLRLFREMGYDDAMGMAAQIAFYALLGLFPFMMFLLSFISSFTVTEELREPLLAALENQMPVEAADYVTNIVLEILPQHNQGLLSFGLLAGLWGASMAIGALITTINRAYNIRPRRNIVQQKILAIILTVGLSGVWILALSIVLAGPKLTQDLYEWLGIASPDNTFWTSIRIPMAFMLNFFVVCVLYYVAPEAKQKFRWILPGAITSTILWFGASSAFRYFLGNFGNYNKTYGSLATLVVLLIWLWISGLLFLLGAEINALMKRMEEDNPPERLRLLR